MNTELLKIFVPENHAEPVYWQQYLIHPLKAWWGDGTENWPDYEPAFAFYRNYFCTTDQTSNAHASFLPLTLNYYIEKKQLHLVRNHCSQSAVAALKTYIWIDGDFDTDLEFEGAIFIKNSSFRSKKKKNEIIRHGDLKKDLLVEYCHSEIHLKSKTEIPTIGFDGLSSYPMFRLFGLIAKNLLANLAHIFKLSHFQAPPVFPLLIARNRIMNSLENDHDVRTNFNKRKAFAQGTKGKSKQARKEYIDNILQSDYTLCIRGSANYSLRLYEVMCLGRIPLFLNTDCVLPFENKIPWRNIMLWVEEEDRKHIGKKVRDFHAKIKEKEFLEMQSECRRIWSEYLSDEGFFKHFIEEIQMENITEIQEI